MKLIVRNKFLSPTGKSTIKNEAGEHAYLVKGSFMNPKKTKKIYNREKELLYVIKNKFWNWMKHTAYIYNADGELLGSITKHKYLKARTFETEGFDSNYKIERKLFSFTSEIFKDDKVVGTITRVIKLIFKSIDTYILDTDDEENIPFYLALVLAVDNIGDEVRKDK